MPVEPSLREWVVKIAWHIAFAVALAAALALNTEDSLPQALRYLAAISGVWSLVQGIVALARRRDLSVRLSEWGDAILFMAISACVHFLANRIE